MCRLAGYIGHAPATLSSLLYDPPHSLQHAAYAPREMLSGHVNVDGTGVAWWDPGSSEPLRYVTDQPPWADPNLPGLAHRLRSGTILAAVRSATPGIGFGPANVAPFVDGGLAGVHNGWIGGFRGGVGRNLVGLLNEDRFGRLDAMNDSLVLFSLVAQALEVEPGTSLGDAVTETLDSVAKQVLAAGERAALNLVVATADSIVAARTSAGFGLNSLYVRREGGASWIASEPLDDSAGWAPVEAHHLAVITRDGIDFRALQHEGVGG